MSEITRLVPKGMLGTPATVVDELVEKLDDIVEIYVAVKFKDGTSDTFVAGNLGGLTFAMLLFNERALEAL